MTFNDEMLESFFRYWEKLNAMQGITGPI